MPPRGQRRHGAITTNILRGYAIPILLTLLLPIRADAQRSVNFVTEGNLASSRSEPLKSIDEATSSDTPVDLIDLAAAKVKEGDYEHAAMAFSVGMAYGSYDTLRVADRSAHQGITVLFLEKMGDLSTEQKTKFKNAMAELEKNNKPVMNILARVGKPSYHPSYMIQHGIKAFEPGQQPNGGLVEGFDGDQAWAKVLGESGGR